MLNYYLAKSYGEAGAFDFRIVLLGFEPSTETKCCVLGQDTALSRCLSPPKCIKKVIVLRWSTSIPSRGSRKYPKSLQQEINEGLMGHVTLDLVQP